MNHMKLTFFVTQRQSNIGNFKSHLSLNCLSLLTSLKFTSIFSTQRMANYNVETQ